MYIGNAEKKIFFLIHITILTVLTVYLSFPAEKMVSFWFSKSLLETHAAIESTYLKIKAPNHVKTQRCYGVYIYAWLFAFI